MEGSKYTVVRIDAKRNQAYPIIQEAGSTPIAQPKTYHFRLMAMEKSMPNELYPVYEGLDHITAAQLVSGRPDWYKLLGCGPITTKVNNPDYSVSHATIYPWCFRKETVAVIDENTGEQALDPENGEQLTVDRISWYEDIECQSVGAEAREFFEGSAAQLSDFQERITKLENDKEQLEARNRTLSRKLTQIESARARAEKAKSGKAKASDKKGPEDEDNGIV